MADILDLPEVRSRVSRLSVDFYHQLNELHSELPRTELIRGIIIQKMPKSPLHTSINNLLLKLIEIRIPNGFTVRKEDPLTLADSEPEPDLTVVRGALSDFTQEHPTSAELVIEVAVTSLALDRENASLYAEAGVAEYWIVLALRHEVEVYRHPVDGVYAEKRLYTREETLTCESVPGILLEVRELFPS
jgi:Uma2 family endonuclease